MKERMKTIPITPDIPTSRYIKNPSNIVSKGPFQRSCRNASARSNFAKSFDNKLITFPCNPSSCADLVIRRI